MNPPSNIVDIYKQQGWNDEAAIQGDIAAGGWRSKVPQGSQPTPGQPAPTPRTSPSSGGYNPDDLARVLVERGGYNEIDARNQAYNAGGRADELAREFGLVAPSGGGLGSTFTNQPTINLPDLYQNLYKSSGVPEIEERLASEQRSYNEAVSKIHDNPFLSEASRVGRLQKLQTDYNNATAATRNEIATKKADIETQLNLQTKQFDINSQQAQQALSQFQTLLAAGALDNISGEDIANITRATGLTSNMIESAIQTSKAARTPEEKTQVLSFDDGKESGFVVINPQTGEIISKQVTAVDQSPSGGGGGGTVSERTAAKKTDLQAQFVSAFEAKKNSYGHVSPQDWQGALASWISRGGTRQDFINIFAHYADPNRGDFQQAYGFDPVKMGLRSK